jgi:hypothetical protein
MMGFFLKEIAKALFSRKKDRKIQVPEDQGDEPKTQVINL